MPHRIEVKFRQDAKDAVGHATKKKIIEDLGFSENSISDVRISDVFTIDDSAFTKKLTKADLDLLAGELFSNPVIQTTRHESFSEEVGPKGIDEGKKFDWLVEVGFQPGVKDNCGDVSKDMTKLILGEKFEDSGKIYYSRQYLISGGIEEDDAKRIAKDLLGNEIIEQWTITNYNDYKQNGHYMPIPKVVVPHKPEIGFIDLNISNEELVKIGRPYNEKKNPKGRSLALNMEEMLKIKSYFSREDVIKEREDLGIGSKPTDAELEVLGQTWSEHCKHKIFNAKITYKGGGAAELIRGIASKDEVVNSIFDTYIKRSTKKLQGELPWVVSTLWDNSGVFRFNDKWLISVKCETHNSPSNEDPFGGAITGIVGVYRDPMGTGKGSKLIFGTYGFFTGDPNYKGDLRPKIHPKRLREGVRAGVEAGGNRSGVPTIFGNVYSHDGYMGKPAIFVLAAGAIPAEVNGEPGHTKRADSGDLIIMCGGRVGIDGIHGATESSMEAGKWITRGHVQMGDPFTQKKMHDFLIEARDMGLYKCTTDNGAGGLSSSVGEIGFMFADDGGANGFELYLDKVPLKYAGLHPWQILVSESQERMTLSVSPDKIDDLMKLARKYEVETTVIGSFTNSGKFYCSYDSKPVTYIDMEFLHKGVPQMQLEAEWLTPEQRGLYEPHLSKVIDHALCLKHMLSRPNICSKEYIVRQFDHEVQGTSVVKPLVGKDRDVHSDGVVLRPFFDTWEGLAVAAGINPAYGEIDTYHMTACGIDEAIRRIIAVGGRLKQIALNDNFCWPSPLPAENNPDARYKLAQLIRAGQALEEYTLAFKTPCVSGKDSMSMDGTIPTVYGTDERVSAPPAVQFSAVGKMDDVRKHITMDVKKPDDIVYVLGKTCNELGGSEYYEMRKKVGLNAPRVDADACKNLYNALSRAAEEGLVESIHGCYKGGLGVALAQSSFAGNLGLYVDLRRVDADPDLNIEDKILYSESAGRFVVTVSSRDKHRFENIMAGNSYSEIGCVTNDDSFKVIGLNGDTLMTENIYKLKGAYHSTYDN